MCATYSMRGRKTEAMMAPAAPDALPLMSASVMLASNVTGLLEDKSPLNVKEVNALLTGPT